MRWNVQGKPVPKDKHHKIGSDGNRHWLIVQDVTNAHGGRYSAIAENDAGIATTSALLTVQGNQLFVWYTKNDVSWYFLAMQYVNELKK